MLASPAAAPPLLGDPIAPALAIPVGAAEQRNCQPVPRLEVLLQSIPPPQEGLLGRQSRAEGAGAGVGGH